MEADLRKILIGSGIVLAAGTLAAMKFRRTIPTGVKAIKPFNLSKYLGKWYEIARMDFLFEKHIRYATAEYSLNEDGSVKVVNSGYNYKKLKVEKAEGKAILVGDKDEAKLKVSFWGPFYSGYNVIAIDDKYKYALVAGRNRQYLWILSRERQIPEDVKRAYLSKAEDLGFNTSKLIWTSYK